MVTERSVPFEDKDRLGKVSNSPSSPSISRPTQEYISPLSRIGKVLNVLRCRHRRSKEDLNADALKRYHSLLASGKTVPEKKQKEWYDKLAWWSEAKTKNGARIFVLAPRGPEAELDFPVDMRELWAYSLCKMHEVIVEEDSKFALVWVQLSDHRVWPWNVLSCLESLHERYSKNLEAVHVVHPSWSVRILRLLLWPLASDELWDYFYSHERVEFLDSFIDMKTFRLPKDVYEYDKWLDKQSEELHKQQQAKYGGGPSMFGGALGSTFGMSDEERQKNDLQMEELKRLLQAKGMDGTKRD